MSAQDPELSAALGWPGGISDPVLDRKTLLQMVAALRLASQQALEALEDFGQRYYENTGEVLHRDVYRALRAALAQEAEPVLVQGELPPRYVARSPVQAEPVQMHPSQFAELIKGKEAMIGVPVYWSEWPTKETQ